MPTELDYGLVKKDPMSKPIEWKELYAIVMAYSKHWAGKRILFHCDNKAVTEV